jgi:hypothetical protein
MIPSTGRRPSWALPTVRLKVPAVPIQCSFICGVPTGSVVDPDTVLGSGSRIFGSAGTSLLRADCFSCSLDVLYEGLRKSKYQFFWIRKRSKKFWLHFFSSIFGHQNPGSRLDLDPYPDSLKMLDPDPYPDPDSINPDLKWWIRIQLIRIHNTASRRGVRIPYFFSNPESETRF